MIQNNTKTLRITLGQLQGVDGIQMDELIAVKREK